MPDNTQAKQYSKIRNFIFLIELILDVILLCLLVFSNLSIFIKKKVFFLTDGTYLSIILFAFCIGALFYLVKFPLEFYSTFILEHRFNLSNQTVPDWFKFRLKLLLISSIIGFLFILILYFFLNNYPVTWWIFVGLCHFFITVIIGRIFPVFILPIFYKYKSIDNEELKKRILGLLQKSNTKIKRISEINLSKDSKKANAALIGIGQSRQVILSDTLVANYSIDEIEVVLAHELGHLRLAHIPRLIAFNTVVTFSGLFITSFMLQHLVRILGLEGISDIAAMPLILAVLFIFGLIMLPLQNGYSRHLENSADRFAIKITKLNNAFISAMEKLARQNLSDINPSRFIELVLYDHPPIAKRIELARNFAE